MPLVFPRDILALLTAVALTGCAARPVNPSFGTSSADAKKVIRAIQDAPVPLDRPVVACAGWADPGFVSAYWPKQIRRSFTDADHETVGVKFTGRYDFDGCRDRLITAVDAAFPTNDPDWTVEVDVVAFSMGGLVARYAAAPPVPTSIDPERPSSRRRLKIRRLFTISTPHRGATMARVLTPERRIISMRAGSPFLTRLDQVWPARRYDFVAYTRLHDPIVGTANTAPPGVTPYWVAAPPLARSHQEAYRDPRIVADILRRLRGNVPLTAEIPVPLP